MDLGSGIDYVLQYGCLFGTFVGEGFRCVGLLLPFPSTVDPGLRTGRSTCLWQLSRVVSLERIESEKGWPRVMADQEMFVMEVQGVDIDRTLDCRVADAPTGPKY